MGQTVVGCQESQEGFGRTTTPSWVLIVNVGVHRQKKMGKNILRAHDKIKRNQRQWDVGGTGTNCVMFLEHKMCSIVATETERSWTRAAFQATVRCLDFLLQEVGGASLLEPIPKVQIVPFIALLEVLIK